VLGAGYAGLAAARGLNRRVGRRASITLVNPRPDFVERVRLHQLAVGQPRRRLPLASLAGSSVRVVVATVTSIDPERRVVRLNGTLPELEYDVLVYALGSGARRPAVPGLDEVAHCVADLDSAARLRSALRRLPSGARVGVVGAGLTGIETAAELAESRADLSVRLFTAGDLGAWLSPAAREHLAAALARAGVTVDDRTVIDSADAASLHSSDGRRFAVDLTIWTGGFAVPAIAREAGLAVDHSGRVIVDDQLRSVSHPDVFAAGDAAAVEGRGGGVARMSCQTALPMGAAVARVVAGAIRGRKLRASAPRFVWTNISIGRSNAVTQFSHADDSPRRQVLTGGPSVAFKELITRGTVLVLGGGPR